MGRTAVSIEFKLSSPALTDWRRRVVTSLRHVSSRLFLKQTLRYKVHFPCYVSDYGDSSSSDLRQKNARHLQDVQELDTQSTEHKIRDIAAKLGVIVSVWAAVSPF